MTDLDRDEARSKEREKRREEALKRFRWDTKYLYWGITAFSVIVASILFFTMFNYLPRLKEGLGYVLTIFGPIVWGLVIAYLLWPLCNILEKGPLTRIGNRFLHMESRSETWRFRFTRGLAVALAIIILVILLVSAMLMILPQFFSSLQSIITNSSDYLRKAYGWIGRTLADYPDLESMVSSLLGNASQDLFSWLSGFMPRVEGLIGNLTTGVLAVVKIVYNIFIGIIVSAYLLYNKEHFGGHLRKLTYCLFPVRTSEMIIKSVEFIDDVFIGFLSGKMLDSLIICVICYICCLLMNMPYSLLVSLIIGVTNMIPFFGPFIGAIPSAVIILMEEPIKCVVFLIFITVLQQFDGNVLGPKVLGNSVGVNGFWILFSILIGARLFGLAGMLLGVPVFVVIYTGLTTLVDRKLRRRGLPTDSEYYRKLDYIDPETGEAVILQEKKKRGKNRENPWEKKTGPRITVPGKKNEKKQPARQQPAAEKSSTDKPSSG